MDFPKPMSFFFFSHDRRCSVCVCVRTRRANSCRKDVAVAKRTFSSSNCNDCKSWDILNECFPIFFIGLCSLGNISLRPRSFNPARETTCAGNLLGSFIWWRLGLLLRFDPSNADHAKTKRRVEISKSLVLISCTLFSLKLYKAQ